MAISFHRFHSSFVLSPVAHLKVCQSFRQAMPTRVSRERRAKNGTEKTHTSEKRGNSISHTFQRMALLEREPIIMKHKLPSIMELKITDINSFRWSMELVRQWQAKGERERRTIGELVSRKICHHPTNTCLAFRNIPKNKIASFRFDRLGFALHRLS